jgi:hypothetical protein
MTDGLVGNSDMTKLIFSTGGIASWTFFPVKPLTDTSAGIGVFDVSGCVPWHLGKKPWNFHQTDPVGWVNTHFFSILITKSDSILESS